MSSQARLSGSRLPRLRMARLPGQARRGRLQVHHRRRLHPRPLRFQIRLHGSLPGRGFPTTPGPPPHWFLANPLASWPLMERACLAFLVNESPSLLSGFWRRRGPRMLSAGPRTRAPRSRSWADVRRPVPLRSRARRLFPRASSAISRLSTAIWLCGSPPHNYRSSVPIPITSHAITRAAAIFHS